jgi:general secretion pathway protein M
MSEGLRLPPPVLRWYGGLQPQERRALVFLLGFLALVMLWLQVWVPLREMRDKKEAAYLSSVRDVRWMQAQAPKEAASGAPDAAAPALPDGSSLLTLITASAQGVHITISHAEPVENDRLHLTLENVAFSRLLVWLEALQHDYGISATQVSVERVTAMPGYVSATLELKSR